MGSQRIVTFQDALDIIESLPEYQQESLIDIINRRLIEHNKIKEMLQPDLKVRVMLFFEDEDSEWNKFAMSQFLKGYSEGDEIYDRL